MARPRKETSIDMVMPDSRDEKPVLDPQMEGRGQVWAISDNPYLTEEQKELLFNHEFSKIFQKYGNLHGKPAAESTILTYWVEDIQPTKVYVRVNLPKRCISDLWEFYRSEKGADVKGFIKEIEARTPLVPTTVEFFEF